MLAFAAAAYVFLNRDKTHSNKYRELMMKNTISTFTLIGLVTAIGTAFAEPLVYVPLGSGNQVIEIDAATDQITKTFTGIDNPHGLVATPDGEYLIAGSLKETPLTEGQAADSPNSKLALIHVVHGHVMSSIEVSGWTHHQAISPDGRYVISTHPTRGSVSVVDLHSNKLLTTISTGPSPNYTVFTPDGKRAYVSNSGNNSISEIDVLSWVVLRALESGPAPEHLVLSKDEKSLFVTNPPAGKVSEISISTGKVTGDWKVGDKVHGLDIGDDGKTLFISAKKGDLLVALNTKTGDIRSTKLTPAPYHLNTVKGTGKVYVSSRKKAIIWVVDQQTLAVVGEIKLPGGEGHQMAIVSGN
jgi:DNA-binding beta-propeller fold protein YncE